MLVFSADLEGMLGDGRYVIQQYAVTSRTRATPYVHNFGEKKKKPKFGQVTKEMDR